MIRLFVAIPLPDDIRQDLARLSSGLPGGRWISPENMHLTLRFIGEVEEHMGPDIDGALGAIRCPEFTLRLNGVSTFGRGHTVHTAWAGIDTEPALTHLHAKIEQAMVRLGLEPERRKFTPHVTLARIKNAPHGKLALWLESYGGYRSRPFAAAVFALVRSRLGNGGAHYEVLSEYPLQAATLAEVAR